MAINPNRPVISYENIALFQSDAPAHNADSNSGQNLSFLPLVQGINFSIDVGRTNVGALGAKDFIDQSNRSAPDVNLTIDTIENFGNLFSGLISGSGVRDDLNIDENFYAAIGGKTHFDVSGDQLTGREMLSFGNCFLSSVSISQSVKGLLTSEYTYVGSNIKAETLSSSSTKATGLSPSINLNGDQSQSITCNFDEMSSYYTNDANGVITSYNTNVSISGSTSFGNFLIKSDSIQGFNLNLPIQRKTINSLGKKYPVNRKALFPSAGSFDFSNLVSSFELTGARSNFKDFLSSDEDYFIDISGRSTGGDEFDFQIQNAKLVSQSQQSSIGATASANLGFSFELNNFKKFDLLERFQGASLAYSLRNISSKYTGNVIDVRRSSDNTTQGFTAAQVVDGTLLDFVNAVNLYPARAISETDQDHFDITKTDDRNIRVISDLDNDGETTTKYVHILTDSDGLKLGRNQLTFDVKINSGDTTNQLLRLSYRDPFANATQSADIQEGSNTYTFYITDDNIDTSGAGPKIYFAFHQASTYDVTISNIEVRYFGVDKLDLRDESGGLNGNVSNETSTGFDFSVNNEGSDGYKNLLATADVTAGTYEISFHALLNSGSLTGCSIYYYNTDGVAVITAITEGANFLSVTPQVGTNIFFRVLGTSVADVSITNITLRQTAADGHVSQWYDQSTNANHATQTDPTKQPKIVDAGSLIKDSEGRPEIDFNGSDQFLDIDFGSDLSQPNSIFMVHQSDTTNSNDNEFFDEKGVNSQRSLLDVSTNGGNYRMFADTTFTTNQSIDTNKNLIAAFYDGESSFLSKNGTASSAGDVGSKSIAATSSLGFSESVNPPNGHYYDGTMQEFIVYNSNQSANRVAIEENIRKYFNIQVGVDTDGDGVVDSADAFPNDATESADTDGDGVGDNADAFPNDASESVDTDGDGVGDNADPFPNDPSDGRNLILTEDNNFILTEGGDFIVQES